MTKKEKQALLFLISVPGIGNVTITKLMERFHSAEEILNTGEEGLRSVLKESQLEAFLNLRKTFNPENEWEDLTKKEIRFLTRDEAGYPDRLKVIPDPPWGLFFMGELPGEDVPSVAVIGARDCTEYGKYIATELGKAIAKRGFLLISGMARGIDGIGQQAALSNGGKSYAVLGSGVDVCYPESNRRLYESLKKNGGILSIYPPKTPARPQNFPPRNRIVSGLADVLVVVEGRVNSGTLITVDMALEQGKEVYAVPGRITDRLSDGCNRLIRQGAGVFLSPEIFLEEMEEHFGGKCYADRGWKMQDKAQSFKKESEIVWQGEEPNQNLTEEERMILKHMDFTPQSREMLSEKTKESFQPEELTVILMRLTLKGKIVQVSPGQFALRGMPVST